MTTNYPSGWRLLATRRWLGYLALAVAFAIACVCLGAWQFARLDEARTQVLRIERNFDATPVPLEQLLTSTTAFDAENTWRPVVARGTYLVDEQLLVRSRPFEGQVGFEVLTPLLLEDGRVFVINRGWIPSGTTTAEPGTVPEPPEGEVTVVSRLKPSEPHLSGREATEGTIPTIELSLVDEILGKEVFVGAYGSLAFEDPATSPMPQTPLRPELNEGPHLSYALQWLLFAVMGFVGLSLAVRNERRIKLGISRAADKSVAPRRSDESEEDEALDAALR